MTTIADLKEMRDDLAHARNAVGRPTGRYALLTFGDLQKKIDALNHAIELLELDHIERAVAHA